MRESVSNYKSIIAVLILGICSIICVSIASNALTDLKQNKKGGIVVTGSATQDFKSDTIYWRGNFSEKALTTKEAYAALKKDEEIIKQYLIERGVGKNEIDFSSVDTNQDSIREESVDEATGKVTRKDIPDGYTLTQSVMINSSDVDKIADISREITQLIDKGVLIESKPPEYYYSKLDELKIEMIAEATKNAKLRAETIVENADSHLDKLTEASLGVFQITAWNSSSDEYSAGGAFNTSSKWKTAQITVKLNYNLN